MQSILVITQSVFAVLFIFSVLLQEKGSALSLTFGGGDNDTFYASKQGIDKLLSYSSYLFATLFVINAVAYMIVVK